MTAHAKLSASGSHRWIACPGSVKAEEHLPNTSSIFADEGTAAHELAELCLLQGGNAFDWVDSPLPENNATTVTNEMAGFVQQYVDYVRLTKGERLIEQRVDFSHLVPEGFGTSDAIIIEQQTMSVVDLKYGKGIPVSAFENPQGLLYALGALNDYGNVYDIKTVNIVIVQPRLDHVDEWTLSVDDLKLWGERIKQAAERATGDNPPRAPGEKQCQWCKAKATCPALFQLTSDTLLSQFEPLVLTMPDHLSDKQLADALGAKKLINAWLESVEALVAERLESGQEFKGYKLVEGRSNRAWVDEAAAAATLGETFEENELYERKFISPAKAEKLLGKAGAATLEPLVVKPQGAPTLVPDSDKRPSITVSAKDFDTLI